MEYTVTIERKAAKFLRDLTDKRLFFRFQEAMIAWRRIRARRGA
jgi:hypothetical protein